MECDESMEKFKNCVVFSRLERRKLLDPQGAETPLAFTTKNDLFRQKSTRYNGKSSLPDKKRCLTVVDEEDSQIHTHKQNNQNEVINGFDITFSTPKKRPLIHKEHVRRKLF